MTLLRRELGATLRRHREAQRRTLRDVAARAGVSLGYLSEVERGVKEASSELLDAICGALAVRIPDLLVEVAEGLRHNEVAPELRPAPAGAPRTGDPAVLRPAGRAPSLPGARTRAAA